MEGTTIGVGISGTAGGGLEGAIGMGLETGFPGALGDAGTGVTGAGDGIEAGMIPTGVTIIEPALLVEVEKLTVPITPAGGGEFDGTIIAVTIGEPDGPVLETSTTGTAGVPVLLALTERVLEGVTTPGIGGVERIVIGVTNVLPAGPIVVESITMGTAEEIGASGLGTAGLENGMEEPAADTDPGMTTSGEGVGVTVTEVTTTFPDGSMVVENETIGGATTGGAGLGVMVIAVTTTLPSASIVEENNMTGVGMTVAIGGAGLGVMVIAVSTTLPSASRVEENDMTGAGVTVATGGAGLGVMVTAVTTTLPSASSVDENDTKGVGVTVGSSESLGSGSDTTPGVGGIDGSLGAERDGLGKMIGGVVTGVDEVKFRKGGVVEFVGSGVVISVVEFDSNDGIVGVIIGMLALDVGVAGSTVTDTPSGALTVELRHLGAWAPHLHSRIVPQLSRSLSPGEHEHPNASGSPAGQSHGT